MSYLQEPDRPVSWIYDIAGRNCPPCITPSSKAIYIFFKIVDCNCMVSFLTAIWHKDTCGTEYIGSSFAIDKYITPLLQLCREAHGYISKNNIIRIKLLVPILSHWTVFKLLRFTSYTTVSFSRILFDIRPVECNEKCLPIIRSNKLEAFCFIEKILRCLVVL